MSSPAALSETDVESASNQWDGAQDPLPNTTSLYIPGTFVIARDEQWMVTAAGHDHGMIWLELRGQSGIVRDTTAKLSPDLEPIESFSAADTALVPDDSPQYRRSRLWLEATLRKTPEPISSATLTVADQGLVDALPYQLSAVRKALDPKNPQTRILLADAVGLGKTIEIGMILSELIRRGRGDRILIVTPRHVLEQTQLELWSRFALPFVRLDSAGIQKVRQQIPATRNPFTYYKRAIVSIDTLKSEQYSHQIGRQHWDAVVIDESHNLSNSQTQNNRLASTLARNTDALILASATPHNGREASFAELIRLLDPTAVTPDGKIDQDRAAELIIRRHRHSDEVAQQVGSSWAQRATPKNLPVDASMDEDAVAQELSEVWLHPTSGSSPYSGSKDRALFPWTLAKAFLSSQAALIETIDTRLQTVKDNAGPSAERETEALTRLRALAVDANKNPSSKLEELVRYLKSIGIGKGSDTRVVVFAERIATLHWLEEALPKARGMPKSAFAVMHGSLSDQDQQDIVAQFRQGGSPLRVLITGDVASEGVNLHAQCHDLVHFDIPWSLIRIEQRNGRIDRYGQKKSPQIATIALVPSDPKFSGDIRVLTRLMEKEDEAHRALGDVGSLMGKHTPDAEEEVIRRVLAGSKTLEEAVQTPEQVMGSSTLDALFAQLSSAPPPAANQPSTPGASTATPPSTRSQAAPDKFLFDALQEAFNDAASESPSYGGVGWKHDKDYSIAELTPPPDLVQRLKFLPQAYLAEQKVTESMKLATSQRVGKERLAAALSAKGGTSWPDASYLAPLHPVLDWAADRALSKLGRGEIFAFRGDVVHPTVLVLGTATNELGGTLTSSWVGVTYLGEHPKDGAFIGTYADASEALSILGVAKPRTNIALDPEKLKQLQPFIPDAHARAEESLAAALEAAQNNAAENAEALIEEAQRWDEEASGLTQRTTLKQRRKEMDRHKDQLARMASSRRSVRPILMVLPNDWERD